MTIGPAKKALRKQTADVLRTLQRSAISAQSTAVLAELATIPAYTSARSASVYLPMDGSSEIDTWPILAALMARGVKVAVPRVAGPKPGDMRMLRVSSYEQAVALPRTKWGIPEPDEALAAGMEDMTGAAFDLLLVPGVAFDARCNRLGHGRGYYDCFVSRQRALERREMGRGPTPNVTVIGLGLTLQLVETVPVSELDERLDMVVHPGGQLAFADSEDLRTRAGSGDAEGDAAGDAAGERWAKSLRSDVGADPASEAAGAAVLLSERVQVKEGTWKYVCLRVTPPELPPRPFLVVRSAAGSYHRDVGAKPTALFEGRGCRVQALGGGRIKLDAQLRTAHVYGFSVGLGGDEGGPPGRGMPDHAQAAALVRLGLPGHVVTFAATGY